MSKITRVLQKIFGGNSSDIVQFGSRAANSTLYTQDVGLIQSLSAWTAGWRSALIAKEASLQDQDAVNFVTTSQLAYLFQEGMPEYDASTTYYTNSIVKKNGTTQLYVSLTDNNIGNPLADTANWAAGVDIGVGSAFNTSILVPVGASIVGGHPSNDGSITLIEHNLNTTNIRIDAWLVNIVAENSYTVGQKVPISIYDIYITSPFSVYDANNISIVSYKNPLISSKSHLVNHLSRVLK